jgi:carboxymethylenebutenolidase
MSTLEGPTVFSPPSRRAAVGGLFFAGFALSAGEVAAQAITTDARGLETEEGTYPAASGYELPYYLAKPEGEGPYPAVIVVNEVFGIHEYIKDVCRRLAHEGYLAIAPDYFDRAGDPAALADMQAVGAIVSATPQDQVLSDTEATLQFLRGRRDVFRQRIAITGFCWGGAVVWLAAARFTDIRAGVAWYGRLTARRPGDFGYVEGALGPIDVAPTLQTPVLGLYAQNDRSIPLESVDVMRSVLALSGNPSHSEIIVYPDTDHGFHADYRPSYNEAAARDGWHRMLAWFRANGVA